MYYKQVYVYFITLLILNGEVNGKKAKKTKFPPIKEDDTSPQPNVVAYSTFGFNDVGSYDGFVPSSPDYSSFLSGANQESTTRLYAPAFPTASDILENNYGSQPFEGQTFNDDGEQSSMLQYPQSTMTLFGTPILESDDFHKNKDSDEPYRPSYDDTNSPVYGTKLNLRNKNKFVHRLNNSELQTFDGGYSSFKDDNFPNFVDAQPIHENKQIHNEPDKNYNKVPLPSFPTSSFESYVKPQTNNVPNQLKFPTVVDFTNMKTIYSTALDNIVTTTSKPTNPFIFSNPQTEMSYTKPFSNLNKFTKETSAFGTFDTKTNEETTTEKDNILKSNPYFDYDPSYSFPTSNSKNTAANVKPNSEHKKKSKNKPWSTHQNFTNNFKNWKDVSALKGYEYTTNNSNMTFKYEFDDKKKPFRNNVDEIVPASSNVANYQFPGTDYSKFKKIPKVTDDDDFSAFGFTKDSKWKDNDYSNLYKDLFSTVPTTTSYWGNAFGSNDYAFLKNNPKKSPYVDDIEEEVVNIPKRPYKSSLGKHTENIPSEWSFGSQRPYKLSKPQKDWNKAVNNRFKSEEDLLGLRNHDTSHPSYIPTYKPTYENNIQEDNYKDYRNLIEKWRQSYLKSKLKDSLRDYEAFATENKPQHVPMPKPYPIEVPHPVIVPVPQPYPVRVPISKPVAVPVIQELKVPIEKPVPYPVFKNVPYPVEKPVPVRVEKEVAVPVIKPYPVPVPYVRPVFHHTRHPHSEFDSDQRNQSDDGDYMPRPEGSNKKPHYKRRPYGSRNRSRRPSRNTYQERNRRRWPDQRHPALDHRYKHARPEEYHQSHYRHHEPGVSEDDRSDRFPYCKRNGHC
ncbi:hypothetical protein O3G_MSEX004436 [Manduca sexta]|uniref:Uncharacterized protein n=1 Tax=Manduca sexta TaxID=7130 RepID=A0A921YUX2_MANSE|nr:hypothetical protein O3G_MSEX004436 [Manduca sexta]